MQTNNHQNIVTKADDEISIKDLILKLHIWFNYLLGKWLIIFLFGMLGGILGFTYAYFKKPMYTSSTTFVLENGESSRGGLGQYAGLASMMGIDLGGGGGGLFQGDNIIALYKSRTMIEKTLLSNVFINDKKQSLIDYYINFNELRKLWSKNPELKNIKFDLNFKNQALVSSFTRLQDSVLGAVVADINQNYLIVAKPDKKLNIIRVDVRAEDETFAKVFNDEIVRKVNDFYIQTKTKKSLDNVAILKEKTDSVRAEMNGAIYKAASIADATPNLNPTKQVQRAAPIQRSQFTAETNKAILGELVKNLEMSKIALLKETPLIQVVDQPVYPLYKEKIGKLKSIILGGFSAGFLTIIILLFNKIIRTIMA